MNSFPSQNGKISIHEPLEVTDPKHPEEIFERDILERQQLAKRILNRLRDDDCPRVLGIYGGWGTGKTSLLNIMKQLNQGRTQSVELCIEFIDAWEYEASEGLLLPVVVALKRLAGDGDLPHVWKAIVKRTLATTALSVTDALLKKFLDLDRKQIKETYEEVEARDEESDYVSVLQKWELRSDEIAGTKKAFEELVGVIKEKKQCNNVVICIDNLDRCSPENVVRLLESVKVFFNVPHCTWVFAMDAEVVASYVTHKYEGTKMDGNSYLDKIIPEQYHLSLSPGIDREKIVNLLRRAAGSTILDFDEENIPQLPRVLVPRRLIKSATKFSDFYQMPDHETRVSPPVVFNLALLYHVWPDFYQRFSSASETHICGILDNFFPADDITKGKDEADRAKTLPLLKDYADDQDLTYFLKTVFNEYQNRKSAFVDEIINGIGGLRMTGLP